MPDKLNTVLEYHQRTKHHLDAYARGPGFLDWASQPNPFKRFSGCPVISLERTFKRQSPFYEEALRVRGIPYEVLNANSISQLFFDSLAISAWKGIGNDRWALRVNPSSGNLHPTESYLICGAVEGLAEAPIVCHYAPDEHVLEVRARFAPDIWEALVAGFPDCSILIGLTSIFWREAWKYGERAYRYCQHDLGHAIAAINIAAGGLGWGVRLLNGVGSNQISSLLGLSQTSDPESEYPEALLVVYPQNAPVDAHTLPAEVISRFEALNWQGQPNRLSPSHRDWPIITKVAQAASRPEQQSRNYDAYMPIEQFAKQATKNSSDGPILRDLVRGRRSAVAFDGRTHITSEMFFKILQGTLPDHQRISFLPLTWAPLVHMALFVHLVDGLQPGLYLLVRNTNQLESLRNSIRGEFLWEPVENKPVDLDLYLLAPGDARHLARQISCNQDIAAYGCFSLGMLAQFEPALKERGAWFYPHLYWECGMIGQVLYLEAEAVGLRGTGIGCFFDDAMHSVLSINDLEYQDLYHFTIGSPLEDIRLTTFEAYSD